ncbi:MAG: alpha/beta hydrolase [Bacteroidota bacterium]|nr:alpha/beta hydrolase [Bacteroidota bacterium]
METTHKTGTDLFADVDNLKIAYDDMGTGKIPLIFIHGFPFDKSMWELQMKALSKNNRAIAYDIRGYGKSSANASPASMTLFADDLIKFMDALEIDKAIVCGLSMGGYILLNAVHKYPDRFKAIILSDTQCIADSPEAKEGRGKTIATIREGKKSEFTEGFIKKVFIAESLESKKDSVNKIKEIVMATSDATIIAGLTALAEREETCSNMNRVEVPALVICGDGDVVTPLEQSRVLNSRLANSSLVIIENAGHLSNMEQPENFNRKISEFIELLPA